jgi:hypothetical protein
MSNSENESSPKDEISPAALERLTELLREVVAEKDATDSLVFCAICGKSCDLRECAVTHDGKAVHEKCLTESLSSV